MELIIDGQPPEISDLILDAEYDTIVSNEGITEELALVLRMIRELSYHIHYDSDYYRYILSTDNLWENEIFEYASYIFYPNMPDDARHRYHIDSLIRHMPEDMLKCDDYYNKNQGCLFPNNPLVFLE